jgi:viologen exporter family transport system permease protein
MSKRPYLAAFASGAHRALGQPGELAVRITFYAIILLVFIALWRAAETANGGSIAGYTYAEMLWYVAGAEATVIATKPRMIEDIGDDIGSGAISIEMLRPVSVVGFRMAVEMGEALVRLAGAVIVGAVIVSPVVGPPPSSPGLLLAIPAMPLGVACNLALQHAFAAAAFWLQDAKSSWFLYQKLVFLLGGMLLPIELFPDFLERAARFLPFVTVAYAPARLLSGHPDPALLLLQLGWLIVLMAAALGVFRAGEQRLQVAGG